MISENQEHSQFRANKAYLSVIYKLLNPILYASMIIFYTSGKVMKTRVCQVFSRVKKIISSIQKGIVMSSRRNHYIEVIWRGATKLLFLGPLYMPSCLNADLGNIDISLFDFTKFFLKRPKYNFSTKHVESGQKSFG